MPLLLMEAAFTTIRELILHPELRIGLTVGTVALALALVIRFAARRNSQISIGALLGGGCILGYVLSEPAWLGLVIGGSLMAAGGSLVVSRNVGTLAWLLLGSGCLLITATARPAGGPPLVIISAVAILLAGTRMAAVESGSPGRTFTLLAISAGGLVVGSPDVEPALVLAGALLPIGFVALWQHPFWRLGSSGDYLLSGVYVFALLTGSAGRLGAMVGGIAGLGLLMGPQALWRRWPQQMGFHFAWVLYAARVVGLRTSLLQSVGLLAVGLAIAVVVWKLWHPRANSDSNGISAE